MMMLIAWLGAALAVTPGGFRHSTAQHVDSWSVRNVFIYSPDIEIIDQITPRLNKAFDKYGLDAEVSVAGVTGPGGDIFAGVGSLQAGTWRLFKGKNGAHHRFGLVAGIPFVPRSIQAHAFGSAYQDTLMGGMAKLGWRVGWNEEAPWDLQLHLGLGQSRISDGNAGGAGSQLYPIFELAMVKVVPMTDRTSFVFEQDFTADRVGRLNFRPMVRWGLGEDNKSALDLGLQLPLATEDGLAMTYLSAQILTQYQSRF
jgi:hypothetical protein